jgi:hypothetical protein
VPETSRVENMELESAAKFRGFIALSCPNFFSHNTNA